MRRTLAALAAIAAIAAGCSGSDDAPVIERQVSSDTATGPQSTICNDVEAFALGSHEGDDIDQIIDELGRLGAVLGANGALPRLADMRAALADNAPTARALDAAAQILDDASYAECRIPVFTAMYVSTSFASCFGRAPIAAGQTTPDAEGCETNISPGFLPCFNAEAGYLPIDCRSGERVVLRDATWVVG